jgi:transposase
MRLFSKYAAKDTASDTPKATRRDFLSLETRRRQAMKLLDQGISQAEVARRLEVSEVSVCRWNKARVARGGQAWKRGRLGKPPKVNTQHLSIVQEFISSGARTCGFPDDRWTYSRVSAVLKDRTGLRIHPDHLCRIFQRQGWVNQGHLKWGPSERRRSVPVETPMLGKEDGPSLPVRATAASVTLAMTALASPSENVSE